MPDPEARAAALAYADDTWERWKECRSLAQEVLDSARRAKYRSALPTVEEILKEERKLGDSPEWRVVRDTLRTMLGEGERPLDVAADRAAVWLGQLSDETIAAIHGDLALAGTVDEIEAGYDPKIKAEVRKSHVSRSLSR